MTLGVLETSPGINGESVDDHPNVAGNCRFSLAVDEEAVITGIPPLVRPVVMVVITMVKVFMIMTMMVMMLLLLMMILAMVKE